MSIVSFGLAEYLPTVTTMLLQWMCSVSIALAGSTSARPGASAARRAIFISSVSFRRQSRAHALWGAIGQRYRGAPPHAFVRHCQFSALVAIRLENLLRMGAVPCGIV